MRTKKEAAMIRALFAALTMSLLFATPAAAAAKSGRIVCGAVHTPRYFGREMLDTTIGFRNANPDSSVTISRLTIRNSFGDVVHDSGPATLVPHPVNADYPGGLDVTTVPPLASFYLTTTHIWGLFPVPVGSASGGFFMSAVVEFTTDGDPQLVVVGASLRGRERIETFPGSGAFFQGEERSRSNFRCDALK